MIINNCLNSIGRGKFKRYSKSHSSLKYTLAFNYFMKFNWKCNNYSPHQFIYEN
jgi:hypothetical protein